MVPGTRNENDSHKCLRKTFVRIILISLLLCAVCIVIDDSALDLLDQVGDGDAAWAGIGAVEDGAAAPYPIALA